jgi:plasmid rolling circle replication initiator protein Rep
MQSYTSIEQKKEGGGDTYLDKLQLTAELRRKKAKAKWINLPKVKALEKYALDIGDCAKSYQRAKNCCNLIISKGGKLVSSYCFDRSCLNCSRIKTAKFINEYQKDFEAMSEPYFVTLTSPNVSGNDLKAELKRMKKVVRQIADIGRKKGILLKGIRKTEITYNTNRNDYHPHFHFIIDGEIEAGFLLCNWMKRNLKSDRKAQDLKKADIKSLKELFKYALKETDGKNPIPIENLHFIYKVLKGERTFQSMGNFAPKIKKIETDNCVELVAQEEAKSENERYVWNDFYANWINPETGEFYSDYSPTEKDKLKRQKYEKMYTMSG